MLFEFLIFLIYFISIESKKEEYSKRYFPDIFLLGERKAASTTIANILFGLEEFCQFAKKSEGHYFSKGTECDWMFSAQGRREYHQRYKHCSRNGLTMDTTPNYARHPEVVDNIVNFYGILSLSENYDDLDHTSPILKYTIQKNGFHKLREKKFIISMREPTLAAFSWYSNHIMDCKISMEYYIKKNRDALIKKGIKYYPTNELCRDLTLSHHCASVGCNKIKLEVHQNISFDKLHNLLYTFEKYTNTKYFNKNDGLYYKHLKLWMESVGRKKIFVISFENLIKNPTQTLNALASFLNLKKRWDENFTLPHENDSASNVKLDPMPCKLYEDLYKYYEKENMLLYELIEDINKPYSQPFFPHFKIEEKFRCT